MRRFAYRRVCRTRHEMGVGWQVISGRAARWVVRQVAQSRRVHGEAW